MASVAHRVESRQTIKAMIPITNPDFDIEGISLKDRVILITGATGGLGRALAKHCGRLGATVVLTGRNVEALESIYDELEAAGAPTPAILPVDQEGATQPDYAMLATTLSDTFGKLHGLVHCAAQTGMSTQIEHYPVATWSTVMTVNLHSAFLWTRALLPLMDATSDSSVTFTVDNRNTAFWGAYGVSKAGLMSLSSILADEIEGKVNSDGYPRVAVNTVDPGAMRTKLRQRSFAGELPSESPLPETKTDAFVYLLARRDPKLHAQQIILT